MNAIDLLPDLPRWVETRDLLGWDGARVHQDDEASPSFVVWSPEDQLGSVVGTPQAKAVREAAAACAELLAFPENIEFVRGCLGEVSSERAKILLAPEEGVGEPHHACRFLRPEEVPQVAPEVPELAAELASVAEDGKDIYAAFDGETPVAFAYVASETESLWDVSIDTLSSHRRRGYAASAVAGLAHMMNKRGKRAVWGAAESNKASYGLARKLGFEEVDELWVLTKT
ncbi:MAG: GNAT family N-acetyltransferase [Myxococcota bacterium]